MYLILPGIYGPGNHQGTIVGFSKSHERLQIDKISNLNRHKKEETLPKYQLSSLTPKMIYVPLERWNDMGTILPCPGKDVEFASNNDCRSFPSS